MSYDVYLQIDTGGSEPVSVFDSNYTSNVSGMWAEALGYPLADLAMEPSNGWGNYEGARDYLTDLLEGCVAHPKTTIYVSR